MNRPELATEQRILIVDDSARSRLLLEAALRTQGYTELKSVDSAQAAYRELGLEAEASGRAYDLILMDLLMPDVDGIEACLRIKSTTGFADVPVIMVTAEDAPECLKAAFDAGATDYVKKPVSRVELAARVKSALRLKQETECRQQRERELVELTEKLRELSHIDGLTEVANRRAFENELERTWRRAQREGGEIALILVDIDHFKSFNDRYGHPAGDDCLRRVAATLRSLVKRPFDLVARYGGEEFAILLPGTHAVGAGLLAEEMRCAVEAMGVLHAGAPRGRVTISCGVAAVAHRDGFNPADLVWMADRHLYDAKHAGRNCVAGRMEPTACV